MIIFPSIFLFGFTFAYLYSKENRIFYARIFWSICFLIFFLPVALQYQVGVDYQAYANIFRYVASGQLVVIEPGYYALNYAVSVVGGSFQVLLAIITAATITLVFTTFPKQHFHLCVAVFFLVFYSWIFTTIRQMFVVAVAYYCFTFYYSQKRYFSSHFILAIASLIHVSSLIYIPVFALMRRLNLKRNTAFYIFILLVIVTPIAFEYIKSLFSFILTGSKYSIYFNMDSPSTGAPEANSGLGRALRFFVYFTLFLPIVSYRDKIKASNGLIFMLLVFTFDMLAQQMGIFARVSRAFLFGYFILIVSLFTGSFYFRIPQLIMIFASLIMLFIGGMINGVNLPYRTILF